MKTIPFHASHSLIRLCIYFSKQVVFGCEMKGVWFCYRISSTLAGFRIVLLGELRLFAFPQNLSSSVRISLIIHAVC